MNKEILYVIPLYGTSVLKRNEAMYTMPNGNVIRKESNKAGGVKIPVQFAKDNNTHKLITGLDEIVDNPWHEDMKPDYNKLGSNWKLKEDRLKSLSKISKQTLLEIYYDLTEGSLSDKSGVKTMGQLHLEPRREFENQKPTMLDSFFYPFDYDHITTLDSSKSLDEALAIQAVKNNPKIFASSKDMANITVHKFYLAREDDDLDTIKTERRKVQKAVVKLDKLFTKYTEYTQYQMAINLELTRDKVTPSQAEQLLEEFIWNQKKTNQGTIIERTRKFNEMYSILERSSEAFEIEYMVRQALNKGIFRIAKGDSNIYWPNKKGADNYYNLGRNFNTIKKRLMQDRKNYDESIDTDNMYGMLYEDLSDENIRLS